MLQALRPAHFADVHEALDAGLDLNEGAVIRDAYDFAVDARACRESFRNGGPGIGKQLLAAKRNALLFFVEFQDLDFNIVAGLYDRGRMGDASPDEITHVKKAVHAAEIDEDAVVGDVLHFAGDDGTLGKRGRER